jgi:phosphoribosylformylglycinamidine synthase subunit PurS
VTGVRQGKVFDIEIAETDRAKAEAALKAMCDKLLANTVIEDYRSIILRGANSWKRLDTSHRK